jgi:hypothetical protein
MTTPFKQVLFDPKQKEIARVNRATGVLYLKPQVWDHLPESQKNFVLLHEEGHLNLQTKDEFTANAYAVKNFLPIQTLTNKELGAKIVVMQSILTPGKENPKAANDPSNFSGFGIDPVSNIAGAVGSIFESLPMMGIGAKARNEATAAQAAAQATIISAQAEADSKKKSNQLIILIVGGSLVLAGLVLFFVMKKR